MIDAELHEVSLALQPPVETVRLLTVQEVAELLRVPVSWVYDRTRLRGSERLPHIKVGKYLRFRAEELERYIEALRRD
jgi:excisionase family DNA binding protein